MDQGEKVSNNIIFGINSVKSLLVNSPEKIIELFTLDNKSVRKSEIIDLANKVGIKTQTINKDQIEKMLSNSVHQGVVAKIKSRGVISENDFFANLRESVDSDGGNLQKNKIVLILDQVQDPHNFGAILRTANASGVSAVVITKDKSVKITPVVSKVASGGAELTTIVEATNLARFIEKLKQNNFWIVGADMGDSDSIYELDTKNINSIALVLGAEGVGLRDLTKKNCDFLVNIPMHGQVGSLNVSVAAGVLLFELRRVLR